MSFRTPTLKGTPLWPALLIIIAVLSASAVVSVLLVRLVRESSRVEILLAGVIPALVAGILLAEFFLRRPLGSAPIWILIAAAFIPFSLPTGTGSRVVDSLILTGLFVGLWVVQVLMADGRLTIRPLPINKPFAGFVLAAIISLLWGVLLRDPLVNTWDSFPLVQLASMAVLILLPASLLLVANETRSEQALRWMTAVLLLAGVLGLIDRFDLLAIPVNTSGLFSMWVVALSASLALFNRSLSRPLRLLLGAYATLWIYWGFGLNVSWMAGWVPAFIVLGVLAWMRSKILFVSVVLIIAVVLTLSLGDIASEIIQAEMQESGTTRLAAWEFNWSVTRDHLLFGMGPAGYAVYYVSFFPQNAMATHSNYLDILAQMGIFGLVFLIWFLAALIVAAHRIARRVKERNDFLSGYAMAILAGTIGASVMMFFGDWLFPFAYTQTIAGFDHAIYSWLLMGSIYVVDRVAPPSMMTGREAAAS